MTGMRPIRMIIRVDGAKQIRTLFSPAIEANFYHGNPGESLMFSGCAAGSVKHFMENLLKISI